MDHADENSAPPASRAEKVRRALALTTFATAMAFYLTTGILRAEEVRTELEYELDRIAPLKDVHRGNCLHVSKVGRAHVGCTYSSRAPWAEICAHYHDQLYAQGWSVENDRPVTEWGRDYGGRIRRYSKGDRCASLQYAGEQADHGWRFSLDFTWDRFTGACR
jgi:hypothetical protein